MRETKELNTKNQTYYFLDDMINIKNFQSNLLKIDKKLYKDFDICYIGYVTIKKIGDYENIHSVNPLYLTIYFATGYFKKEYGVKYLIIDLTEKYEASWILVTAKNNNCAERSFIFNIPASILCNAFHIDYNVNIISPLTILLQWMKLLYGTIWFLKLLSKLPVLKMSQ